MAYWIGKFGKLGHLLLGGGGGSGGAPASYTPSLDFSDERNSMYVPAIAY